MDHDKISLTVETEIFSNTNLHEARKRMVKTRAGEMSKGLDSTNPTISYDEMPAAPSTKYSSDHHTHNTGCPCGDNGGSNKHRTYSFFDTDPWPSIEARDQNIVAYDSDAFSIEEKGEVGLDALPWSGISGATQENWLLSHSCDTECWHKDPVGLAALRYERAGRFEDASKLRNDFRGLSNLHSRVFQWYIWAGKQEDPKDSHEKELLDMGFTALGETKLALCPGEATVDGKKALDITNTKDSFHGRDFLPAIFCHTTKEHNDYPPRVAISQTAKGHHRLDRADGALNLPVDLESTESIELQLTTLDSEGIIPQQIKEKIFRKHNQSGVEQNIDGGAEDLYTDRDESITYRNYARWVLENRVMSDDSDYELENFVGSHVVVHGAGEPKGPHTKNTGLVPAEDPWDDPLFLGDPDSSDYCGSEIYGSELSGLSDDSDFPTISGEELVTLLEETKGTIQFQQWQSAPVGRHQNEFKTLINLHRFAKESEARNQKHWRSRERAEKEGKPMDEAAHAAKSPEITGRFYKLPGFDSDRWQGLENKPVLPHTPLSSSSVPKPEHELPVSNLPNANTSFSQNSPKDLRATLQSVGQRTEDQYFITADDVKFLRELKRELEQIEAIQQNHNTTRVSLPTENLDKRSEEYQSKPGESTTVDFPKVKSLRNLLRTVDATPRVGRRTEYEHWFPQNQPEQLAHGHRELSRSHHDGPIPKRHYITTPLGDVSFRPGSSEYHPFFQAAKSPIFKKLVISAGRFWNPLANISLSGFWVTENLFITALNFHPWAPSTNVKSLHDQVEDFKSRNDRIALFVSNGWLGSNDDPEAIKVVLRAWDTSSRIAIFQPEDIKRVSPNFVGVDTLIETEKAYSHNGAHIATVGYNPPETAGDPGSMLFVSGNRSVTFGEITICEGHRENKIHPPIFARLESGFSHGSYGRMCIIIEAGQKNPGSIVGLVTGQCEESGIRRPESLSDFVSIFPTGFTNELRRISES